MKPSLKVTCAALCLVLGCPLLTGAEAPSLEKPTHKEIEPIKIAIGNDGHLKTIAMDSKGNLLVGVSWLPEGAAPSPKHEPPGKPESAAPGEARGRDKVLKLVRDAVAAATPEAWDKVADQVTPQEFRDAMSSAGPAERRPIMEAMPPEVRQKLMAGFRGPGGSPGKGRPQGPGGQMSDARGGILPQLSIDGTGHIYALKVVSPDGKVLATWPMTDGLQPKMIFGHPDGTVYVAGGGRLAQFDDKGKRLRMVDTDAIYGQKAAASGLCADEKHVFIAFGMGNSLRATEDIYRFKRDLTEPAKIVERQYGCCSHIDLRSAGGELLIAENSRHRVNRFDPDGKQLGTWGRRDREDIAGFTACCNPCNFDFGPGGVLYTAESGVGRVKKYAADGTFLGLVGHVDTTKFDNGSQLAAISCYIPIEVNHDASRIYVMDVRAHIIRVLAKQD